MKTFMAKLFWGRYPILAALVLGLASCAPAPASVGRKEETDPRATAGPGNAGQGGGATGEESVRVSRDEGASAADQSGEGGRERENARRSGFDYYVLALSWSPAFCADPENAGRSPEQCAAGRPYDLVVHGLWPQYEKDYPIDCPTDGEPSPELVTKMLDIMPSPRLVAHEWRRHGGCSGLDPEGYFAATRKARNGVKLPELLRAVTTLRRASASEIESAFLSANPGLGADEITLQCRKGRFQGVRICLDKAFKSRVCSADIRETCPEGPLTIAAIRAGKSRPASRP